MPVVKLSAIKGTDIPSLINSLERQRKELEFILASLDNANVIELSGDLISGGLVKSEFVESGAGNEVIQADVDALKVQVGIHQEDIGLLETEVFTNIPFDIDAVETRMTTAETDIDAVETRTTSTETRLTTNETWITQAEARLTALENPQ